MHAADKSGVKPSVLSLPSGPGAIEGLGESFEPQLNTGTATYRVPLKSPPGRAGFAPDLALTYNSGNGGGTFGLGWSLGLPSLQRQTDKGLPFYTDYPSGDGVDNDGDGMVDDYDEFDTIVFTNGEELVPCSDGTYRFENEQDFTKFVRSGDGWIGTRRDGATMKFGLTTTGRIEDSSGRIFKWLLEEIQNTNGIGVVFSYEKLDASPQRYLTRVTYNTSGAGDMSVRFGYEARPDIITDFRPSFELRTAFRCNGIRMYRGDEQIRTYRLAYHPLTDVLAVSLLASVTEFGRGELESLPPASFGYTAFEPLKAEIGTMPSAPQVSLNDANIDIMDINSDALPDIVDTNESPHDYYVNLGLDSEGVVQWSKRTGMTAQTGLLLGANTTEVADMDGDGKSDLLDLSETSVVYYRPVVEETGIRWEQAGSLAEPGFAFSDPNIKLLDVNNDKYIDVMKTESLEYVVWINLGDDGWSEEFIADSVNPLAMFNRSYIRLADMNGDRLQDLVWIEEDFCAYYPAKGFGSFGTAIEFENPPDNIVNPARVNLADINGDGRSDALYIGETETRVYINLGLNTENPSFCRFANAITVSTPTTSVSTSFRVADVNGNASTDILFNVPGGGPETFTYVDFAPGEQPYQLATISNGIGLTTTIQYTSSTLEMARDRTADRAWRTPPPFPVPVISKVKLHDGLNTYVTTYAYHDGYYDAKEMEFRGFAAAEKFEIGDNSAPTLVTLFQYHTGENEPETLKGRPKQIEAREATITGPVYFREAIEWHTQKLRKAPNGDPRAVTFAFSVDTVKSIIEKGNGPPVDLRSTNQYLFDPDIATNEKQFGVVEKIIFTDFGRTDSPNWDDERKVETTKSAVSASGKQNWILDKTMESLITDENGAFVARKQNFYDGSNTLGSISKGNLTRVADFKDATSFINSVRNVYDSFGNIVAIHDALSDFASTHFREIAYDNDYHTFPVQEIIHTGGELLSMSATYDPGFGAMTSSTDFNGFTSFYDYDPFARLVTITKPPDGSPTLSYDYQLAQPIGGGRLINWVETRQADGTPTLDSRTFYDGLGRKVMTRSEGEDSGLWVVSDTVQYNARQNPARKFLPYFDGGGIGYSDPDFNRSAFTSHVYDGLGRETQMVQPDGTHADISYGPLRKLVRDEEQTRAGSPHFGCGMEYVEDGLRDEDGKGRLREVYEIVKLSDTGESLDSPVTWKTAYAYNLLDNFTGYTDAQNNQKHVQYDALGRKTFMDDPDRGHMHYVYDDVGNLIQTTDAKSQVIRYEYDGANRLLREFYSVKAESPDVEFYYDIPAGAVPTRVFPGSSDEEKIANEVLRGDPPNASFDRNDDAKVDSADVIKAAKAPVGPPQTDTAANTRGYLAWVRDQSGEEHRSYDARGRVVWTIKRIQNTGPNDLYSFQTKNDYDSMDRVTRLTYPDGDFVDYRYNTRGLLEEIPNVVKQCNYNEFGQFSTLGLACGVTTQYSYDIRQRLIRIHSTRRRDNLELQDLNYTYDAVSNITTVGDGRTNAQLDIIGVELGITSADARKFRETQNYQYDSLYRLTQAANGNVFGSIRFRYDRIGNMVEQSAELIDRVPGMNLGKMHYGGAAGAWNRNGRGPNDPPGPHALSAAGNPMAQSDPLTLAYDSVGCVTGEASSENAWDSKLRLISSNSVF
ncbi:MAG TPA: toxin TcdB middle/N-terminal domain-containing protein, partial [Candidatus Hydrogenedentes bacterium]|nr:toxin TcdB middle/N-terminal domain-containing protein [Candidatus Hydrogenedentota bacterium]